MPHTPPLTTASTVRIFQAQADALKVDYPRLSTSALVRVLLQLFLTKKIPEAYPLALEEMIRADEAQRRQVTKRVSVA
jgi:hypothetical protein